MNQYVLIVAGGSGTRMQSAIPKQFLLLAGKPVLMHTLERFYVYNPDIIIVLILPKSQFEYWNELCHKFNFTLQHTLVAGGDARFFSVKNGLDAIAGDGLVAIHDGVRPLVSDETISRCFNHAQKHGNATPCMPVIETVRKITETNSQIIDRSTLRLIQTPQVFSCSLIKKAYQQPYSDSFTDDTSVLEQMGETIHLVDGNRENIKITEPLDLIIAENIIINMTENPKY